MEPAPVQHIFMRISVKVSKDKRILENSGNGLYQTMTKPGKPEEKMKLSKKEYYLLAQLYLAGSVSLPVVLE